MRAERGQLMPLAALGLLFVLLVCAGFTIDVGAWYRAHRHAQAVADAAALAAVQALPGDTAGAASLAQSYAAKNGGMLAGSPSFSTSLNANDTVRTDAVESAPTYFARVVGIGDISVRASATARAYTLSSVGNVVPIAISEDEPALNCGTHP